jgi:hypothetical protein
VPVFGGDEDEELLAELRSGPTALIAPAEDRPLWRKLGAREVGRVGNRVLLDVPRVTSEKKGGPMGKHGGADKTSGVWDTAPGVVDISRAKGSGGRSVPPAAPDPSSRRPRRSA